MSETPGLTKSATDQRQLAAREVKGKVEQEESSLGGGGSGLGECVRCHCLFLRPGESSVDHAYICILRQTVTRFDFGQG